LFPDCIDAASELILEVALNGLGIAPGTGPCHLAVLLSGCTAMEVFAAIAALAEFTLVYRLQPAEWRTEIVTVGEFMQPL
jgi:hypothetical protein